MRISREGVYPPERLERKGDLRGNPHRYILYISKGMHSHAARGNESMGSNFQAAS